MVRLTDKELEMCNRWDSMSDEEFEALLNRCGIKKRRQSIPLSYIKLNSYIESDDIVININKLHGTNTTYPYKSIKGRSQKPINEYGKRVISMMKKAS